MNHAQRPAAELDALHHVAVVTHNLPESLRWYREHFRCHVVYEDDTWAMLQFDNVQLALVVPQQHPPHLGFAVPDAGRFGPLREHRDGTCSTYVADPAGNVVEMVDAATIDPPTADAATADTLPWPHEQN